jgi:hypothetical protein
MQKLRSADPKKHNEARNRTALLVTGNEHFLSVGREQGVAPASFWLNAAIAPFTPRIDCRHVCHNLLQQVTIGSPE